MFPILLIDRKAESVSIQCLTGNPSSGTLASSKSTLLAMVGKNTANVSAQLAGYPPSVLSTGILRGELCLWLRCRLLGQ